MASLPISSLIKQQADGMTCIYITWWRYALLAMAFAVMIYVLATAIVSIIKGLPKDYRHHWNKNTVLALIVAFGIIVIVAVILHLLTMGLKAL